MSTRAQKQESTGFWLSKPKRFDFMTLAILIPVVASATGLFLMAIESFVFVQFGSLSSEFPKLRATIALTSGFFMAFGGEIGTVANNTEIFSKYIKSKLQFTRYEWDMVSYWDWFGFGVSWFATTLSVIIASSTREIITASWQEVVSEWLVIPLMIISVGDVVFGTIELGFRFGAFDARMVNWINLRQSEQNNINYLKSLENDTITELKTPQETPKKEPSTVRCWCGAVLRDKSEYNTHKILHIRDSKMYDTPIQAMKAWKSKWEHAISVSDIEFPTLLEITRWRKAHD
jgi:hypothetical protein